MCPYDTAALGPDVVAEARRSHPLLQRQGTEETSDDYLGSDAFARPFGQPLSEPPPSASAVVFQAGSLGGLRSLVWREAMRAGLGEARAGDAVTAVNEVASNSLRHAGGSGVLRIWPTGDSLVCEVSDDGVIDEPSGRSGPTGLRGARRSGSVDGQPVVRAGPGAVLGPAGTHGADAPPSASSGADHPRRPTPGRPGNCRGHGSRPRTWA